jgi:hypothetical protein
MHQTVAGFALTLILGLLVLVIPDLATAEEPKTTGSPSQSLQAVQTHTISVVGDSLGDGLWSGLSVLLRHNRGIKVARGAKNSVGFTGAKLTEQIDRIFKAGNVDALVVMVGGNDDRQTIFVDGKPVALFGTQQWSKLYKENVSRYMDYICGKQVPIIWVLLPIMRSEEASAAAKLVNDIIESAAKDRPQISLVPTWDVTADANGAYMPFFKDLHGATRLMRTSDGMHFTDPGQEFLADMVWKRLQEISPTFRAIAAPDSVKP